MCSDPNQAAGRGNPVKEPAAAQSDRGAGFKGNVIQMVRLQFDDGSTVIAPEIATNLSARSVTDTIGDVVSIVCKLFPKLCGAKDPGEPPKGGCCYTIIGPDGTKITICPPGCSGTVIA